MIKYRFLIIILFTVSIKFYGQSTDTLKYILPEVSVYGESKKEF